MEEGGGGDKNSPKPVTLKIPYR